MIRTSEIFPYLALYGQKLIFFLFGIRDKDKQNFVKGTSEDEIGTIFLKSDIYHTF